MSKGPNTPSVPIVTVLMYAFRHAAFISRALESLFAQQFSAWELIVLDDASPDETAQIVAAQADGRIRYERLGQHTGMGAALSYGLQLVRDQYVAYLPADDLFYPDHLQELTNLLAARPDAVAAYGDARWGYNKFGETACQPATCTSIRRSSQTNGRRSFHSTMRPGSTFSKVPTAATCAEHYGMT